MKTETKITIALIIIIAYAFYSTIKTFAMSTDGRSNACRTFHVFAHEKEAQGETDGLFCGNNSDNPTKKDNNSTVRQDVVTVETPADSAINDTVSNDSTPTVETEQDTPEQDIQEDNTPSVDNTPTPVVNEDKKPKCNNGEGNGSEGCSPAKSPNANNDENNTTPKEDKSSKS